MLRHKHGFRGIHCSLLLLVSIPILVTLIGRTDGFPYVDYRVSGYDIASGTDSSTNTYNPSEYAVLGSTSQILGSIPNLTSNDGVNMVFSSYFGGTDLEDYVDNNLSNLDNSTDNGTHGNFTAQQYGPDATYDTLTEAGLSGSNSGAKYAITGSAAEITGAPDQTYAAMSKDDACEVTGYQGGTEAITQVYFNITYYGTVSGTLAWAYQIDGGGWTNIEDLPEGGNATHPLTRTYNATNLLESWTWELLNSTDVQFQNNDVGGSENGYVDAMYVTVITELYEIDLEAQWIGADYDETGEELALYVQKGANTHALDASGGYMIVGDGTPDWGSATGTISFWIKWDSRAGTPWGQQDNMELRVSGSALILDWGATSILTSTTAFTVGKWYFIAVVWSEDADDLYLYVGDQDNSPTVDAVDNAWANTVSGAGVTSNRFMGSTNGQGDELRYWNSNRSLPEIQGDYDIELAGSETGLTSYFKLNDDFEDLGPSNDHGSGSGSYAFSSVVPFDPAPTEAIHVDVWDGTGWQNVFTDLTSGWNNISVSSYLDSAAFAIRFKGNIETGDTMQDTWNIDVVLLHTWTDQYIAEVEFAGTSNTYNWQQLNWTIDSAWTIGSVSVTIQLFNCTLGNYPVSGIGYVEYTSSSTPNTDETKYQLIMSNPQDFRNDTGGWKIKVYGVTNTDTEFDLNVDLIEFEPTYPSGSSQPFNWFTALLFVLPLMFVLLFILILLRKRRMPRVSHVDKKPDGFSKSFGMTHQQMVGQKMLLEIDPTSSFHNVLSSFVSEAKMSGELLFILTNKTSTLHSAFSDDPGVKFLLFTSKTSSSQRTSQNETLLPATDLSVLLDAFSRIQKAESNKTINVLFDNISDIILRCGFEKTYKFTRFLLEAISSPKTTALFLFNPTAHKPSVSSSIRGLFRIHLAYTKQGPSAKISR